MDNILNLLKIDFQKLQCKKIESPKIGSPKIEWKEKIMLEKTKPEKGVWRKIECMEKAVQWNLSARKMSVSKMSAFIYHKKECKQLKFIMQSWP